MQSAATFAVSLISNFYIMLLLYIISTQFSVNCENDVNPLTFREIPYFAQKGIFSVVPKEPTLPVHLRFGSSNNEMWGYKREWKDILCHVKANPAAEITWWQNDARIDGDSNRIAIISYQSFSVLRVKVDSSTVGDYICRADNSLGASEKVFTLKMGAKPDVPEFKTEVIPGIGVMTEVTGYNYEWDAPIFGNHTTTHGNKTARGETLPVKGYVIQIRPFGTCEYWWNTTTHSHKKLLRSTRGFDLLPGRDYRIRLASLTKAGEGEFSRAQTIKFPNNP